MTTEQIKATIETEPDEISLKELILKFRELWKYLLSKWAIIIAFGMVSGGMGYAYAYFKKPIYTATTTFVLEDEKGGGTGNLAGLASMAGIDLGGNGGGIFQGDNILQLYKSRTMLEKTLLTQVNINDKKELLVQRYIDFNKLNEKWVKHPNLINLRFSIDSLQLNTKFIGFDRLRDSILGEIVGDIKRNYLTVVKPDKKLSTIQVDVRAKDEFFAKAFNDELVKNVNEFYIQTRIKKSLQNVEILQDKADSVRGVMNGAIYTAVAVADATPNLNPTRQIRRVAPAQRAQFSAETNKSILAEMVKNLEMTKMSLLKETPLIQVIDEPIYPLPKEKISKIKGFILGGILGGFLIIFILLLSRFFKNIMI